MELWTPSSNDLETYKERVRGYSKMLKSKDYESRKLAIDMIFTDPIMQYYCKLSPTWQTEKYSQGPLLSLVHALINPKWMLFKN